MTIAETKDFIVAENGAVFFDSRFNPFTLKGLIDFFEIDKSEYEDWLEEKNNIYLPDLSKYPLLIHCRNNLFLYSKKRINCRYLYSFMEFDDSNMGSFKIWKLK